jgi:hypothetical protein
MMDAARTSETSVDIQLRTRQYILEDSELQISYLSDCRFFCCREQKGHCVSSCEWICVFKCLCGGCVCVLASGQTGERVNFHCLAAMGWGRSQARTATDGPPATNTFVPLWPIANAASVFRNALHLQSGVSRFKSQRIRLSWCFYWSPSLKANMILRILTGCNNT